MFDRRRRSLLVVLVLVSLALITIDYRLGDDRGPVTALRRGALLVFDPLQEGLATVVRPFGEFAAGVAGAVGERGELREENRALRHALEETRGQLRVQTDLERRLGELRAQLAMRDQLALSTVGAVVIARPPNASDRSLLVDVGADQQVQTGAAVLDAEGLVGKVTAVTPSTARVQLVTSPEAGYGVRFADSGEVGLLSGRGAQPLRLELLDPQAAPTPGAAVVTQAFAGSSIPDGLPVGTLVEPGDGPGEGPRVHAVRPFADLSQLSTVQIVVGAPTYPAQLDPEEIVAGSDPRPPPPPSPPPGG